MSPKNENPKLALSLYERYIKEIGAAPAYTQHTNSDPQLTARSNTNIHTNRATFHAASHANTNSEWYAQNTRLNTNAALMNRNAGVR